MMIRLRVGASFLTSGRGFRIALQEGVTPKEDTFKSCFAGTHVVSITTSVTLKSPSTLSSSVLLPFFLRIIVLNRSRSPIGRTAGRSILNEGESFTSSITMTLGTIFIPLSYLYSKFHLQIPLRDQDRYSSTYLPIASSVPKGHLLPKHKKQHKEEEQREEEKQEREKPEGADKQANKKRNSFEKAVVEQRSPGEMRRVEEASKGVQSRVRAHAQARVHARSNVHAKN
jgi:hypothetical protein